MDWFTQLERRALGPSVLFVLFLFAPFRKRIGSEKKTNCQAESLRIGMSWMYRQPRGAEIIIEGVVVKADLTHLLQ